MHQADSMLFSRYHFSDDDKKSIIHHLSDPTVQSYIRHIVSGEVQDHLISPITAFMPGASEGQQQRNLRDDEMFLRGVISLGLGLLDINSALQEESIK